MIGIIGGYGDVGLEAARAFVKLGKSNLKIGGRNPQTVSDEIKSEFSNAAWVAVDINDVQSLASFCQNCKLIVNCAGPSSKFSVRVAQLCLEKGCHCVDSGTDDKLETLQEKTGEAAVIHAAGAIPGLSGLLPRWLGASFDKVDSLISYTGMLADFTPSAAEDYLAGVIEANKPLAAWQDGECSMGVLRKQKAELPFFPREVTLYPYFDKETEFVAKSLGLHDGKWYLANEGSRVAALLEEISIQFLTEPKTAVERICQASKLDAAGREKYLKFVIQLDGLINGSKATRTLVLQAQNPSAVIGSATAAAGISVLAGIVPAGVRPFSEFANLNIVVDTLQELGCQSMFKIFELSIEQLLQPMEGEL